MGSGDWPGTTGSTSTSAAAANLRPDVGELTAVLPPATHLAGWPPGLRLIVRREHPQPGAQLDAFEERDGYRYMALQR